MAAALTQLQQQGKPCPSNIKAKKHGYYTGTIVSYDHVHRSIKDKGIPYEFENAQQLLNDFLNEVNSILNTLHSGGN